MQNNNMAAVENCSLTFGLMAKTNDLLCLHWRNLTRR